jgi:hypothetical protein
LYLSQNPGENSLLVEEALSRGIDPKYANIIFKKLVKETPENELPLALEEAFTEFDRTR